MKLKDFLKVCNCLVEIILDGDDLVSHYPYIILNSIDPKFLNYDVVSVDTSCSLELISVVIKRGDKNDNIS